jgi:hypothetical protein
LAISKAAKYYGTYFWQLASQFYYDNASQSSSLATFLLEQVLHTHLRVPNTIRIGFWVLPS